MRDAQGNIADGFDASRLRLSATPALVTEPLTRVAPGFYSFAVAAPTDTGEQTLQLAVYFDDQPIVAKDLQIAVDRWVADDGVSARGGCELATPPQRSPGAACAAGLIAALALVRRRRHMRAK